LNGFKHAQGHPAFHFALFLGSLTAVQTTYSLAADTEDTSASGVSADLIILAAEA